MKKKVREKKPLSFKKGDKVKCIKRDALPEDGKDNYMDGCSYGERRPIILGKIYTIKEYDEGGKNSNTSYNAPTVVVQGRNAFYHLASNFVKVIAKEKK